MSSPADPTTRLPHIRRGFPGGRWLAPSGRGTRGRMRWQQVQDAPAAVYVLILDPAEEAVAEITRFAREQSLGASQVTAVGAFSQAVVGWFDRAAKDYRRIPVGEQCEVLSLLGDIVVGEDGSAPHLHAVLGRSDGTTAAGPASGGRG